MNDTEPTEDTAPTQTLEQIASEFTMQQAAPTSQSEAPLVDSPPNFGSAEEQQAWQTSQLANVSSKLNSISDEQDTRKRQEYIETQDKAVNNAIAQIQKDVDMPDEFVEGMLHVKYARDENFRKIFDNRDQNPSAYARAISVVASDIKSKSQWQSDPESAENLRAAKDLQKSANRASSKSDPADRYKAMSHEEFGREWEKMKRG